MSRKAESGSKPWEQGEKKRLLSAAEAAAYLGLGIQTVRNWASEGKLPKVKVHGALRFDIEALNRLIEENSIPARI